MKTEDAVRPTLVLFLILIGILASPLAANSAPITIYIRADGSVSPPTAPISRDGDVYTLTGNIYNSIVIERDNVTLDGAFYTLQGTSYQEGIMVNGRHNVTITDIEIRGFSNGLIIQDSTNITVLGNVIVENEVSGIFLNATSDNQIIGNQIANNHNQGIRIDDGSNNTIFHNNFIGNFRHVLLTGSGPNVWDNGYPSGGNYWNDYRIDVYNGPFQNETGGDGIGDTYYFIDPENQDRYPLMNPYAMPQMLFVTINIFGQIPATSGNSIEVQVYVVCGNSSIENALIDGIFENSSIYGFSGYTNAYGYLTVTLPAPTVATYTRVGISANATKSGYFTGHGEAQLAVQPSYTQQEPYYQPYGSQGGIVSSSPAASFTSALFNTLLSLAVLIAIFVVLAIVIVKASGGRGSAQKRQRRKIIIP